MAEALNRWNVEACYVDDLDALIERLDQDGILSMSRHSEDRVRTGHSPSFYTGVPSFSGGALFFRSRDGIGIMLKAIRPDVLPVPNHTRHEWARWDACIYTLDPDTLFAEFKQRGASFMQELSFIDDGLWGFEATDADGYVLAFFRTRDE